MSINKYDYRGIETGLLSRRNSPGMIDPRVFCNMAPLVVPYSCMPMDLNGDRCLGLGAGKDAPAT